MLIKLRTKNFKKLGTVDIPLDAGLNLIQGANGAGKSTFLTAIAYAFYGSDAISGSVDYLSTWGESRHEVELDFMYDGKTYQIFRSDKKAVVKEEGEPMATGNTSEAIGMHKGVQGLPIIVHVNASLKRFPVPRRR